MRGAKLVVLSWTEGFREPTRINGSTCDVQHALQDQPEQAHLLLHLLQSIHSQPVEHWKDGAQPHRREHSRTVRARGWGLEGRVHCNADAANAKNCDLLHVRSDPALDTRFTHHCPVSLLQSRLAPKAVENAGYEGAPDHEGNPGMVEVIPKLCHLGRMIAESVEHAAHQHARPNTDEEA